jgi:hypothetical protein
MENFSISEDTISKIKKKRIMIVIYAVIISIIIWGILSFFINRNDSFKIFTITLCVSIIFISLVLFFILRHSIKSLDKNLRNVQYMIENERIFIKQNELTQYNFSISEIKSINKYNNNEVIIELNTNKKILVNKYLDSYDNFIDLLNTISKVNEINKNPKLDLDNVNLTKLYSFIIIITLIVIGRIVINVFNINMPNVDDHDPMILLVEVLPILILAGFSVFIGWKIDKRIKNKKYIIIIFFSIQILFLIIFLRELFLESFKLGFSITLIMIFLLLIQVLFLFTSIRAANSIENAN